MNKASGEAIQAAPLIEGKINAIHGATISLDDQPLNNDDSRAMNIVDAITHVSMPFTATAATQDVFFGVLRRNSAWGSLNDVAYFDNILVSLA